MAQIELWLETAFARRTRPDDLVFICALPLYHIFALTMNALMGLSTGGQNILIPNPRDIPAFVKELGKYKVQYLPGPQHAVQCAHEQCRFPEARFLLAAADAWRRHGRTASGGGALADHDRLPDCRGLRPVGNLPGRHGKPFRHQRIFRHDRHAAALDRYRDPR